MKKVLISIRNWIIERLGKVLAFVKTIKITIKFLK